MKQAQAEQPSHLLRGPPGIIPTSAMLSTPGMLSAALQGSPHHNPPTPPRTPQAASPLTAGMPPLLSMAAYMKPGGGNPAGALPPSLSGKPGGGGSGGGLQGRHISALCAVQNLFSFCEVLPTYPGISGGRMGRTR